MFFHHIWCFAKFPSLSSWGVILLSKVHNFFVIKVQHQYQLLHHHHHPTDLYDQGRLFTQYEVFTSPADWPFVWSSILLSFSASIFVIRNINIVISQLHLVSLLLSTVSHHSFSCEAFQGPPPTFFDVPRGFAFSWTSPWLIFIQRQNMKDFGEWNRLYLFFFSFL